MADDPTADQVAEVHLAAVPPYPLDTVGGPIAALIDATPSLPAALVGGAALGALATLAAPARVHVQEGWTEAPILWVPLLGPSGVGKSPALRGAWGPLWDHEHLADRLLDDLTIEALARRLDTTGGMVAIIADELTTTLGSLGRYRRSGDSDRGRLLALWSGAPWRYTRVTGKLDLLVEEPVVVVTGPLVNGQHRLLGPAGDGMRPRWLPHLAATVSVGDDLDRRPPGDGGWAELVARLAVAVKRREWTLEGTARRVWLDARKRWRALALADEPETVRAAALKADVQAARVTLVLAEAVDPGRGGVVPVEAASGAVALVDCVLDVWRVLSEGDTFALSRRDETRDQAVDRVVAWLERRGKPANRRALLRSAVGGVQTAKELDAVLDRYEARYPGTVVVEKPERGGTPTTWIHPPRRRGTV